MNIYHIPVLAKEIVEFIPQNTEFFFDGTLWHWWHAEYILNNIPTIKKYIGVDRDYKMLEKAKKRLEKFKDKIVFINDSYASINKISNQLNLKFDWILLDLWVNMEHFKDPSRWFSIKQDWPLDMRFDTNQNFTAEKLIKTYSLLQLAELFQKYWDFSEKYSKFIASEIISKRKKQDINTTFKLKNLLKNLWLNDKKISVIFQCLRIEVNQELKELEFFLEKFINFLNKWWRIFIITYHSVEDRLVKQKFKQLVDKWLGKLVNKHVIKPSWQEIKNNRAARSAKLRILEKF